ncbi:MAG: hypothetical protein NDJ65_05720 [Paludibacteraceae bacterium]|nr:hypothetical protein [Paludibacteraceae bacterium]
MHANVIQRAMLVKRIVDEHYEPHSHVNSMYDIFINHVRKVYPMGVATFRRYMKYAIEQDGYIGNGRNRELRKQT